MRLSWKWPGQQVSGTLFRRLVAHTKDQCTHQKRCAARRRRTHQALAAEAGAGPQPAQGMQSRCWRAPFWGWHPGTSGSTCSIVRRSYALLKYVAKITKAQTARGRDDDFFYIIGQAKQAALTGRACWRKLNLLTSRQEQAVAGMTPAWRSGLPAQRETSSCSGNSC